MNTEETIRQISVLRQKREYQEAYQTAKKLLAGNPEEETVKTAFCWTILELADQKAREEQFEFAKNLLGELGEATTDQGFLEMAKQNAKWIHKLQYPKGSTRLSPEEKKILIEAIASGEAITETAKKLQRYPDFIETEKIEIQYRMGNLPAGPAAGPKPAAAEPRTTTLEPRHIPARHGAAWNPTEEQSILDLAEQGLNLQQIAAHLQRTPGAISGRIQTKLIHEETQKNTNPEWQPLEIETLKQGSQLNPNLEAIARLLPKSQYQVLRKIAELGLWPRYEERYEESSLRPWAKLFGKLVVPSL